MTFNNSNSTHTINIRSIPCPGIQPQAAWTHASSCRSKALSYLWVFAKAALYECWWGESSVGLRGSCVSLLGSPGSHNWTQRARRGSAIPAAPPPAHHVKWEHCDWRTALIFMYSFFFSSFSQYIMTPDYVTTGIVSDWADHIEIKDEDLILGYSSLSGVWRP